MLRTISDAMLLVIAAASDCTSQLALRILLSWLIGPWLCSLDLTGVIVDITLHYSNRVWKLAYRQVGCCGTAE